MGLSRMVHRHRPPRLVPRVRSAARMAAVCLSFALPGTASALSLGTVQFLSSIGQPLRVEIGAAGARPDDVTRCLRVVPPAVVQPDIPAVLNARLTVAGEGAAARLVVTRPEPTVEPVLVVAIRDTCESRMQREYTLLLPYAAPTVSTSRRAGPSQAGSERPTAPRPAPAARERIEAPGQIWVTAAEESLASLAQALHPRNARARRALVTRLMQMNPAIVDGGFAAEDPLPPGTQVFMPGPAALASVSPPPRPAPAPAHGGPQPEPSPPVRAERAPATTAAPSPSIATPTDRLILQDTGKPGQPSGVDPELQREEQLVSAIDQSINKELELLERIRRLEEIEQALRRQLQEDPPPAPARPAMSGAQAPAPKASSASDIPEGRPIPPAAADPGDAGWMFMLGLLAILVAVLVLHERRRSRTFRRGTSKRADAPAARADDQAAAATNEPPPARESRFGTAGTTPAPTPSAAVPMPAAAASGTGSRQAMDGESILSMGRETPASYSMVDEDQTVAPLIVNEDVVMEHESALELADIMVSFGRVHGAAETLADFIRANPRQSVMPWIRLMEVYRLANMKPEFDALARQLNKTFNVATVNWDNFEDALTRSEGVEILPHVMRRLTDTWATRECQIYVDGLLRDNRDGTRQGLPLAVLDDILMLNAVLEEQLGRYRPEAGEKAA